jgi:hypothetical protein
MPRTKRWVESDIVDGVGTVKITAWKYFHDYMYGEMLDYRTYVYRGHRRDDWKLEPTLDRLLREKGRLTDRRVRAHHLENFQFAVRGRRGPNPVPPTTENDWWALGQHNGLATPLLDWTTSPFVAAFFAYEKSKADDTSQRVVWAIAEASINAKAKELLREAASKKTARPQVTEFFKPLSDENPRLVSQGGLFSRSPDGIDLETWVRHSFKGETNEFILMKIVIPKRDRLGALRSLNRMNINHLSLFPDLIGASQFCNTDLLIDNY